VTVAITFITKTETKKQLLRSFKREEHFECSAGGSRFNIGLVLLESLVALTLIFVEDKLLFKKPFKLVFQLIRASKV